MDFISAIKAMKEGKNIRRNNWMNKTAAIEFDDAFWFRYTENKTRYIIDLSDIEATDWEVYEDKKTLSGCILNGTISAQDTREKLKEFMKWYDNYGGLPTKSDVNKKAKEIFGDKLI